ncbi:MAG: M56 family metallopeptidase [Bacteroidota bacterium]
MDILFSWLIKSFIVSGILYLYYLVALRNKQFHLYNRLYLLGTVMSSILAPFINFKWLEVKAPQTKIPSFLLAPAERLQEVQFFTTDRIMLSCAVIASTGLLVILFSKIVWVFKIKSTGENTRMQGFNFIETAVKQAPFSFLNNLFWKKGMITNDANGQKILKHELVHIQQGHTYDKLFCQLVSCIFWINPFYWLIQKELNIIHEFLADEKSIKHGDAQSFAIMLLHSHNGGSYLNPSHPFFNSSIKRRLIMITSSKNSQYSYIRRTLTLPVGLLLLTVLSVSVKAHTDPKLNPGPVQVTKVSIQKKATGQSPGDSTAEVKIDYVKTDGTPAILNLKNVQYKADVRNPNEKTPGHKKEVNQNDLLQKQHAEKLAAEKAALK